MSHTVFFAVLFSIITGVASAANNFIEVTLPKNVNVELPRNWTALSQNQQITLDSAGQSVVEKIGVFDASSDLAFAASYFEDNKKTAAIFNIRFYTNVKLTQQESAEATQHDIEQLDSLLRDSVEKGGNEIGYSIIEWRGTKRRSINGTIAFVTEYTRTPLKNNGEFCVRLIRVFRESGSFTITISYRLSQDLLLRPICDRIIESINTN